MVILMGVQFFNIKPVVYGAFFDTTTQSAPLSTSAYSITLNSTSESNGLITIVSGSRITYSNKGIYNFQFSLQLDNGDSQDHDVQIWLSKNGNDVANSNSVLSVPSKHGAIHGRIIASWNFLESINAGDFLELKWQSASNFVTIPTYSAGTNPTTPVVPSVILTTWQI